MSKDINIAPFAVNDKVVAIADSPSGYYSKGDVKIVKGVRKCKCGNWAFHDGDPTSFINMECLKCGGTYPSGGFQFISPKNFRKAPPTEYKSAIQEILEKYPLTERIETDALIKETVNN